MNPIKKWFSKADYGTGFLHWIMTAPRALTVLIITAYTVPFLLFGLLALLFWRNTFLLCLFGLFSFLSARKVWRLLMVVRKSSLDEAHDGLTLEELNIIGGKDGNIRCKGDEVCDRQDAGTDTGSRKKV